MKNEETAHIEDIENLPDTPQVFGLRIATMPALQPEDIRSGTAGFLTDLNELVEQHFTYTVNLQPAQRMHIQSSFLCVAQFLNQIGDLYNDQKNPRHLSRLGLEHIPEDVFLALVDLIHTVPGVYQQLMQDPSYEYGSDVRPGCYHLFFVMFQEAVNSVGSIQAGSSQIDRSTILRHHRAAKLLDLQREIPVQSVDHTKPYPIDLGKVTRANLTSGALTLREMFEKELNFMPKELQIHAQRVMDFLTACLDPNHASRMSDVPKDEKYFARLQQIFHWPERFHLGEIPPEVIDSASRVKFFDANLHLALLGHDNEWSDRVVNRHGARVDVMESPIRYNPISFAMQNSMKRRAEKIVTFQELSALNELLMLPAHMQTEINLVSGNQRAQIGEIMLRPEIPNVFIGFLHHISKEPLSVLRGIFSGPMSGLFERFGLIYEAQKERAARKAREEHIFNMREHMIKWGDEGWSNRYYYYIKSPLLEMIIDPLLADQDLLKRFRTKIHSHMFTVDPQRAAQMSNSPQEGPFDPEEILALGDYVDEQYNARLAFPNHLASVKRRRYWDLNVVKMRPKAEKTEPKKIQVLLQKPTVLEVGAKCELTGTYTIAALLPSNDLAHPENHRALLLQDWVVYEMDIASGKCKPFFPPDSPMALRKCQGIIPTHLEAQEFLCWGEDFLIVWTPFQEHTIPMDDGARAYKPTSAPDGSFAYVHYGPGHVENLCFVRRHEDGNYVEAGRWPHSIDTRLPFKIISYELPDDKEQENKVKRYRVGFTDMYLKNGRFQSLALSFHTVDITCDDRGVTTNHVAFDHNHGYKVRDFSLLPDGRAFLLSYDTLEMFSPKGKKLKHFRFDFERLLKGALGRSKNDEEKGILETLLNNIPMLQNETSNLQVTPDGNIYFAINGHLFCFTGDEDTKER